MKVRSHTVGTDTLLEMVTKDGYVVLTASGSNSDDALENLKAKVNIHWTPAVKALSDYQELREAGRKAIIAKIKEIRGVNSVKSLLRIEEKR